MLKRESVHVQFDDEEDNETNKCIIFTKMHGLCNDFIVIETTTLTSDIDLSQLAIRLCDRRTGIGADGLLLIEQSQLTDDTCFFMRMFAPDGIEDMCGNGLRCLALWAYHAGWVDKTGIPFNVETKAGIKCVDFLTLADNKCLAIVRVDMGIPKLSPSDIPFKLHHLEKVVDFPLFVLGRTFSITALNTSSTHTVIFGDTLPDEETFQQISPLIEQHFYFPERTSVLWATIETAESIKIRIWERGLGETLSCGTGACAVTVAAILTKRVSLTSKPFSVISRGGQLLVTCLGEGYSVQMSGSVNYAYDGTFYL